MVLSADEGTTHSRLSSLVPTVTNSQKRELKQRRALVGKRLREARGNRTLGAMSAEAGLSIAYLSDVERGQRPISAARLNQLAKGLSMSDDARHELFILAKLSPPDMTEQVATTPELWGHDLRFLLNFAYSMNSAIALDSNLSAAMSPGLKERLASALRARPW